MMRTLAIAMLTLSILAAVFSANLAATLTVGHSSSSSATTQSLPHHLDDGFDWH
jgi:hypothetical protein